MKNIVKEYLGRYKEDRGRRRKAAAVLACLSLLVAGHTAWALHIDGEGRTGETYCGYTQEHRHTEGCMEKTLVCGYGAGDGADTGSVTDSVTGTVTGSVTDSVTDSVADSMSDAVTDSMPDSVTDSDHTHTDECYKMEYICGYDYEHTHTLSCFSNPDADVETAGDWEKTFADVELTGDFAADLVAVARTQLGYTESADNYQVVLDAEGNETEQTKGYTRYGAWYGDPYGDWDAMFVSFCLYYAGITEDMLPYGASCPDWAEDLSQLGFYEPACVGEPDGDSNTATVKSGYTPETGDLVFFDADGDGSVDHVGIVEELEVKETTNDNGTASCGYTVHTIEGGSGDKVAEQQYGLGDETILGYASICSVSLAAADNGLTATGDAALMTAEAGEGIVEGVSPSSTIINLFDYYVKDWDTEDGSNTTDADSINENHYLKFGNGDGSYKVARNLGQANKWTGSSGGVLQGIAADRLGMTAIRI